MNQSESIKELAAALSNAQKEIENVTKDSTNPHFRSRYASLAAVTDTCNTVLPKHGLSVSQTVETQDGQSVLVTKLMHTSGQWLRGIMPLILSKPDMQGLGSAITYARRYSLSAIVNITQDDDDGNGASGRPDAQAEHPQINNVKQGAAPTRRSL